jgi:hypothetical protein
LVGPYTEIPSDYWKHLARVRIELSSISDGFLRTSETRLLTYITQSRPIYIVHATIATLLSLNPLKLSFAATLVSSAIFLGTIYWFSVQLFTRCGLGIYQTLAAAMLGCFFTLVTFGTASFSFIRYYAYFPTIFNFPLIYISIILFLDYLDRPAQKASNLGFIFLFLLTMALVHLQEALFTIVMLSGIIIIRLIRIYGAGTTSLLNRRTIVSGSVFFVAFLFLALYGLATRDIEPWKHTPHVIDVGTLFPFLPELPIANPTFRFWDTLGFFGALTYIWYFLYWKRLWTIEFLTAGMLAPLVTIFNPLYTVPFLHYAGPTVLWRTAYLMPLSIVAALLFVLTLDRSAITKCSIKTIISVTIIIVLSFSLLPIQTPDFYNRTSRLPSLQSVHNESGGNLWRDLIEAIDEIQKHRMIRRIITDSVTKFIVYSSSRDQIWWFTDQDYFPKHIDSYKQDFRTSDFTDTLLVINRRNGVKTKSAEFSGHWPEDLLGVSEYYPDDLELFISDHQEYFELLWAEDQISIYVMKSFKR